MITLKICLLLTTFSLNFTINGFFFSDSTMHKIFEDKGDFNIFSQIPEMIYSLLISAIINILLKQISLSEKSILSIKVHKNQITKMKNIIKDIKNCLIRKFILFFILDFLLLFFFWYFISCFCAVYINTQIILIEDTLISFALSMVYPFGTSLIPGIFRIPSLMASKKDKKCIYQIGLVISLL